MQLEKDECNRQTKRQSGEIPPYCEISRQREAE
jgi:hypothetical protein